ncbi:hypothetical protein FRC08_011236 [Ceratobasidium sp. 394]|nr:hypothetical protein FRC08_011236 [Ceratobasidium sp. 394]
MLPPLAFGLQHKTNRHRIEKAFNFAYNHILTEKSNHSDNDLWTTSEFQVVEINGAAAGNTTTDPTQDDDDDLDFNEVSIDKDEDEDDRSGTYQAPKMVYRLSVISLPPLRQRPTRRNTSPSPLPATPPEPLTMAPSTPPNAGTQPDMPSTDHTIPIRQGIDQSRIADFAVGFLKTKPESSDIFGISVPLFEPVHVPIIVEGKRPPPRISKSPRVEPTKGWKNRFLTYMDLGKRDISDKRKVFFSVYPSRSYVGITFSGPWWIFTICIPEVKADTLRWSKAFAYHTPEHDKALNIIFKAAQSHPEDPQADQKLVELLSNYEDEPGVVNFV